MNKKMNKKTQKAISIFFLIILVITILSGCVEEKSHEEREQELQDMIDENQKQWEIDWPFFEMSMNYTETIETYTSNATLYLDVVEILLNAGDYTNATTELILATDSYYSARAELDVFRVWWNSIANATDTPKHVVSDIIDDYLEQGEKVGNVNGRIQRYTEIIDILKQYEQI